ncbi:hypothetical protein ABW20_dc0107784 [Dactylellina cionopaga]|nr:hypothetical protein ABW20_dc0107784 [Dactylellina cionopaga]
MSHPEKQSYRQTNGRPSDDQTEMLKLNELRETVPESPFSVDKLREWMIAFIVCDFNVDLGPEIEWIYPYAPFSPADLTTICFNSFPDRNNPDDLTTDTSFHFRFRHTSTDIQVPSSDLVSRPEFWFGYCLFRQQRDETVKRKYGQKSFVVVSQHDFTTLFRDQMLAKTLPLLDFGASAALMESACAQIVNWPSPRPGQMELPFFGSIFNLHIPLHASYPLQGLVRKESVRQNHPIDIFALDPVGSWKQIIDYLPNAVDLYIIFERVLLCEPIVGLALDPRICSEFVSLAFDLIRPIPFAGDYRPYITMHSDIFSQSHGGPTTNHYLIGVTNPFILKRLQTSPTKKPLLYSYTAKETPYVVHLTESSHKNGHRKSRSPGREDSAFDITNQEPKGYMSRDWEFLKELDEACRTDSSATDISRLVRRHFAFLTARFLAPLDRYFAQLITPGSAVDPFEYGCFSETEFLQSLIKTVPQVYNDLIYPAMYLARPSATVLPKCPFLRVADKLIGFGLPQPLKSRFRLYATHSDPPAFNWPSKPASQLTPYEIFSQSPFSTYHKSTFYNLVKLYHPDCSPPSGHPCASLSTATRTERFRLIVAANALLADPVKKKAYDTWGIGWNSSRDVVTNMRRPTAATYAAGPWKHSPAGNATWEDWERWYKAEGMGGFPGTSSSPGDNGTGDAAKPLTTHKNFVTIILLLSFTGLLIQLARVERHTSNYEEKRDRRHRDIERDMWRLRRDAIAMGGKDGRVQAFLRMRDPEGYGGVEEVREERIRRMVPDGEVCLSGDVQTRDVD